jgi:hypothetical protein
MASRPPFAYCDLPGCESQDPAPLGLPWASDGAADSRRAFRSLRTLFFKAGESDLSSRNAQVLRHMIPYAYAAGVIGALIGWIHLFGQAWGFSDFAPRFSVTLVALFYSVIIAECFLRPAGHRIETELKKRKSEADYACDLILESALKRDCSPSPTRV